MRLEWTLKNSFNKMNSHTDIDFATAFLNTLDKHAPEKKKFQKFQNFCNERVRTS